MFYSSSFILAFDKSLPHLRTELGGEQLMLNRLTCDPASATLTAPPEDAFALVFQLGILPAHVILSDGRPISIPGGPAQSVALVDLAGEVGARVESAIDSLHLRIPRAALDVFADQTSQPRVQRLHQPDGPFSNVDRLIGQLSGVLVEALQSEARGVFVDHLLLALMAHLVERYGDGRVPIRRAAGCLAPWQERRAKAMLDVARPPALAEIAAYCGVSIAHFSRAFKASVGTSPWAWHQGRRIEQAKTLMRDPTVALTQIAAELSFADQSHFSRAFFAKEGVSPSQWRRALGIR